MFRTALVLSLTLGAAVGASGANDVDDDFRRLARKSGETDRLLRIGLPPAHRVTIDSDAPFRIVDPRTGRAVWHDLYDGEIQVIAEGGPVDDVPSIFRIQVAAYSDSAAAERELSRLREKFGETGVVHHDPDRGNWRVRLGAADERLSLNPLLERLREDGLQGIWIAEEPRETFRNIGLRLVDVSFASSAVEPRRLAVLPRGKGRVQIDGRSYRGIVELRVSPFGIVRPINWVQQEQYLLGVVPAELGPEVWPELAALKAQAVAARTYVLANLRQFEDEGFDLCSTPRCQVYAGAGAEHPLSNRAVWSTKGEILTWNGEPIAALYTATCGGHTETGSEIFPEHDAPYLTGVPCRAEGEAVASRRGIVAGVRIRPLSDETGADVTRDWALLTVAGVVEPGKAGAGGTPVDGPGLRDLTRSLSRLAGRPEPAGDPAPAGTLGEVALGLLGDLGWQDRSEVLVADADVPGLLRDPEVSEMPAEQRRALAYLAWVEGVTPYPDGGFHLEREVSHARLAPALVRIGESYRAFGLRTATIEAVAAGSLRMVQGKGELRLPLAKSVAVFGLAGGKAVPMERLELWPGDRVRFRTASSGAIDFLELMPPVKGTSDDRSAKVYSWEVRQTRNQLEKVINRRLSIGRLDDLQVVRRGVSGRVVELRIVGSEGTTVVRGFDVRRLLDLRESLLVIEPQRDAKGRIEAVVFAGKGWGHGVGMCQVGAYGMALRGASYDEILAHYYRGTTLGPGAASR